MKKVLESEIETRAFGESLGRALAGGEVIELIGDVGAGKTTFTKGLAIGLGIDEDVQSPSFTISRVYDARDKLVMAHYDFYRLNDAGILNDELREAMEDKTAITVIEWADIVEGVLPKRRIRISFQSPTETTRVLQIDDPNGIVEAL
jgi:tRNA threonylcarbamoyladenosine biosynthesis protein TsaE